MVTRDGGLGWHGTEYRDVLEYEYHWIRKTLGIGDRKSVV